jgi:hypothetical protein
MFQLAVFLLIVASIPSLGLSESDSPGRLNEYGVFKDKISMSGFSSGAVFTVQFHVAFSDTLMGVGVIAGCKFLVE